MKTVPISVVIPAFNRERFIGEAIESVLAQTLNVDEIIVVDNNCTDNTRDIAQKLGAKVVVEKTQGASAARNRGIKQSRNDLIAFLDSDDLWEAEKIEYQWKAIEKFPDAGIISCDFSFIFMSEGRTTTSDVVQTSIVENTGIILEDVYSYCSKIKINQYEWFLMTPSTVILRRNVFSRIGLFDEDFRLVQDMDFFHRVLRHFPVATVKKNLVYYRKHDKNTSQNYEELIKYMIQVTEKMLKFPDKYTPGAGEYYRNRMKQSFIARARRTNSDK